MQRNLLSSLKEWKISQNRKPLILKGVRQVGKTWLLKTFGEEEFPAFHYINLESMRELHGIFDKNLSPDSILQELEFVLGKPINRFTDLLIIDEIQAAPRALTSLKYFYEKTPELAICAAGSLIGTFLSNASFPVGKVSFLTLYPFTFSEFLLAKEEFMFFDLLNNHDLTTPFPQTAHLKMFKLWLAYLVIGGMPEAISTSIKYGGTTFIAFEEVRKVQNILVLAYLADVSKQSGKINANHMERVYRAVPAQLAKTLNGTTKRFMFKGVIPGIKGYARMESTITWLEKAGLLYRVPLVDYVELPLFAYGKENIFKLYLSDVGILGSLSNLSPKTLLNYDFKTFKGYFVENAILQELRASHISPYCWEGRTSEIEFVFQYEDLIVPIEVKAGNRTKSKSLNIYKQKYNPSLSIVISSINRGIHGNNLYIPHYATSQIVTQLDKILSMVGYT
jgi:uncharacterized protein